MSFSSLEVNWFDRVIYENSFLPKYPPNKPPAIPPTIASPGTKQLTIKTPALAPPYPSTAELAVEPVSKPNLAQSPVLINFTTFNTELIATAEITPAGYPKESKELATKCCAQPNPVSIPIWVK